MLNRCPSCAAPMIGGRCTGREACQTQVDEQVRIIQAEIAERLNGRSELLTIVPAANDAQQNSWQYIRSHWFPRFKRTGGH